MLLWCLKNRLYLLATRCSGSGFNQPLQLEDMANLRSSVLAENIGWSWGWLRCVQFDGNWWQIYGFHLLEMYGEAMELPWWWQKFTNPKIGRGCPIKKRPKLFITSSGNILSRFFNGHFSALMEFAALGGLELLSYLSHQQRVYKSRGLKFDPDGAFVGSQSNRFIPFWSILGYTLEFLRKRPIWQSTKIQRRNGDQFCIIQGSSKALQHPRHCNMLFPMFMFGKDILCLLFWM